MMSAHQLKKANHDLHLTPIMLIILTILLLLLFTQLWQLPLAPIESHTKSKPMPTSMCGMCTRIVLNQIQLLPLHFIYVCYCIHCNECDAGVEQRILDSDKINHFFLFWNSCLSCCRSNQEPCHVESNETPLYEFRILTDMNQCQREWAI